MTTPYIIRWEVNLAYQNINFYGKPWVHYGRVILGDCSQEEAIRRAQNLKRLFEPEGIRATLTGWAPEVGHTFPLE